jgi:hypothetical protein
MSTFRDVAFWHLADNPAAAAFVGYRSNNGQKEALRLDGLAAIDPQRAIHILRPSW